MQSAWLTSFLTSRCPSLLRRGSERKGTSCVVHFKRVSSPSSSASSRSRVHPLVPTFEEASTRCDNGSVLTIRTRSNNRYTINGHTPSNVTADGQEREFRQSAGSFVYLGDYVGMCYDETLELDVSYDLFIASAGALMSVALNTQIERLSSSQIRVIQEGVATNLATGEELPLANDMVCTR